MRVKLFLGLLRVSIKILLLEDDALFAESLCDLLEDEGYETTHIPNGSAALNAVYQNQFDLYLLDINVPLLNGLELLKELRDADDATPAIFITSYKDKEILQKSFINGGDDFITKPFDNTELLLRIHALLKRSKKLEQTTVGAFAYDTRTKQIYYHSQLLELSKKEYDLLLLLLQNANTPVAKEVIFETIWYSDEAVSDGALRVHINRLKKTIDGIEIQNIRGIGYKLVC